MLFFTGRLKIRLFLLLCLLDTAALAQQDPYYLSVQIDSILAQDTTPFRFQTAAWNFTFAGDYQKALEYKDRQYPDATPPEPTPAQAAHLALYRPNPAADIIFREAASTRIIIINEAHHVPAHRAFLARLLPGLKQLGYTGIGMEALGYDDTLLNQRGYPLTGTGFYTREATFGNLVRKALADGFELFAYEQRAGDSLQLRAGREKAQAQNIARYMDRHPGAKIIVFCGYDHAAEDTLRNAMGLPMAGQLKRLTGIDPFTVDQAALSEYALTGNRYRKLINLSYDAIFADSMGKYFNDAAPGKSFDCHVYHPATAYTEGRPAWRYTPDVRAVIINDSIRIGYPCLLTARISSEAPGAVPVDVQQLDSPADKTPLLLYRHKKHIIEINDLNGGRQQVYIR